MPSAVEGTRPAMESALAAAAAGTLAWAGAEAGAGPLGSGGVNRRSDFGTRAGDEAHRELLARAQRQPAYSLYLVAGLHA